MNVQIQSIHFDADQRLIDFVEKKMARLERFVDRVTGADVMLRLEKDHEMGNKVVKINLLVPGHDVVAEHRAKSFEEAFDDAMDAVKRQLEKIKG